MMGLLFGAIAGALMSIQGAMNTRLGEKIGLWETTALVQGIGFLLSVVVAWIWGKGDVGGIASVNKFYLLGGVLGVGITFFVMLSMKNLGAAVSVSAILISQVLIAAILDAFGFLGMKKVPFGWNKYVGLLVMIGGLILFQW